MSADVNNEALANLYIKLSGKKVHASDCSTSIAPAETPGPCDCDVEAPTSAIPIPTEKDLRQLYLNARSGAESKRDPLYCLRIVQLIEHIDTLTAANAIPEPILELLGCLYQFVGAHSLEDDELQPWMDALSAAQRGKRVVTKKLLPYTLPQDRPRTNHDHATCECYGCVLERIDTLTAENAQLHHELIEATDSCTTLRLERDTLQRRVTELEKAALAVLEDDNSESCDGDCCEPTCPYAELRSLVTTCAKEG